MPESTDNYVGGFMHSLVCDFFEVPTRGRQVRIEDAPELKENFRQVSTCVVMEYQHATREPGEWNSHDYYTGQTIPAEWVEGKIIPAKWVQVGSFPSEQEAIKYIFRHYGEKVCECVGPDAEITPELKIENQEYGVVRRFYFDLPY